MGLPRCSLRGLKPNVINYSIAISTCQKGIPKARCTEAGRDARSGARAFYTQRCKVRDWSLVVFTGIILR